MNCPICGKKIGEDDRLVLTYHPPATGGSLTTLFVARKANDLASLITRANTKAGADGRGFKQLYQIEHYEKTRRHNHHVDWNSHVGNRNCGYYEISAETARE